MENIVIHRLVEQQSAAHGDAPAIVGASGVVAYRELNHRANAVARYLINHGFRRGSHATVSLPRGADLASVLLAILKAGGSYTWRAGRAPLGSTTIRLGPPLLSEPSAWMSMDLAPVLRAPVQAGPNLPVLVRGSDIACVLGEEGGMLVPHATIVSLPAFSIPVGGAHGAWSEQSGAFDLWAGLMAGTALTVAADPITVFEAAA